MRWWVSEEREELGSAERRKGMFEGGGEGGGLVAVWEGERSMRTNNQMENVCRLCWYHVILCLSIIRYHSSVLFMLLRSVS